MTVDLDWMLDLRDAQVAAEVQRKAELGWFDTEFTMYGCVYLEKGERYYRLSADADKIYDFIEKGSQNLILPSNLNVISERYPVPIGMQDSVVLDVKKALAFKMQELYPIAFFEELQLLKDAARQDSGYEYLLKRKEQVEGCFNRELLKRFDELIDYIYSCNKLSSEHYRCLKSWYADEMKNIEEELIHKDLYEKVFYGIGYLDNGAPKYVVNARKASVFKKKYDLMLKGIYTTPIYSQIYYYNHNIRLAQVNQRFSSEIGNYFTKEYVEELHAIVSHNTKIDVKYFCEIMDKIEKIYGFAAKQTMELYGYRWGIL